jgi:hypothetical protein
MIPDCIRCTYATFFDIMAGNPQICGKPATCCFQWKQNKRYFARCEEHKNNSDQRDDDDITVLTPTAKKRPVPWEEFLVAKIMES